MAANGLIMGIFTLVVYYVSFNILGRSMEVARTTALVSLIVLEIVSAFNFRSFRQLSLTRSPWVNPYLVGASVISLIATFIIVYYDGARIVFETVPLSINHWIVAIIAGAMLLIMFDSLKYYSKKRKVLLSAIKN